MRTIFILFLHLLFIVPSFSLNRDRAFGMNERLGRGINMGNAFEAPTETSWGNPWKEGYFEIMSELGFSHVRLPVYWESKERSMREYPYTVSPVFLERIKYVVDQALKNNLHIIINMHHHEALLHSPQSQKERFLSQWEQIAGFFREYSDSLLFEILNEPNGNLTPEMWNDLSADALSVIRKTNPERTVLIGTANWGGISGLSYISLPEDENIILTLHYYNPFNFTHQGADWTGTDMQAMIGTQWYDSEVEREAVRSDFRPAIEFVEKYNVPVHIGEFGAYSKADMDSRKRWTTFLSRWFEEQGFSWAYWEFSAGFGIYTPSTGQLVYPLVDALLHDSFPDPATVKTELIYESNFYSGMDGWQLSLSSGVEAFVENKENKLHIAVEDGGTEEWHVQLIKYNVPLEKGQIYHLSYRMASENERSFTAYLGRNGNPWSAYSGHNSFIAGREENEYSISFTMQDETDPQARIVFDMGKRPAAGILSNIRLEAVTIIPASIEKIQPGERTFYYDTAGKELVIENNIRHTGVVISTLSGIPIIHRLLQQGINRMYLGTLPDGIYLLIISGEKKTEIFKIVKKD